MPNDVFITSTGGEKKKYLLVASSEKKLYALMGKRGFRVDEGYLSPLNKHFTNLPTFLLGYLFIFLLLTRAFIYFFPK